VLTSGNASAIRRTVDGTVRDSHVNTRLPQPLETAGGLLLVNRVGDDDSYFRMSTWNPDGKWDYWRIGGRYARRLLLKVDAEGHSEPLSWEWDGRFSDTPDVAPGVDQAVKGAVDLSAWEPSERRRRARVGHGRCDPSCRARRYDGGAATRRQRPRR
jgi:hypothetical protein